MVRKMDDLTIIGEVEQNQEQSQVLNINISVNLELYSTGEVQSLQIKEKEIFEQAQFRRAHCALKCLEQIGYGPSPIEIIHPNNILKYSQFEVAKAAITKLYELGYTPKPHEVIHPSNIMNLNL